MPDDPGERFAVTDRSLRDASFTNVDLAAATFTDVNLRGARFTDVDLRDVAVADANLAGMRINGILVSELLAAYGAARPTGA